MARKSRAVLLLTLVTLLSIPIASAQEKKKNTIRGAGLGALVGQVIGGDTEATVAGAAVGAGVGYVIGNEKDKKAAEEMSRQQAEAAAAAEAEDAAVEEPGEAEREQLDESRWRVVDVTAEDFEKDWQSKLVIFRSNGKAETVTTYEDGNIVVSEEKFRIVGNTLVINKPGYLVNIDFELVDDDELILSNEKFTALLKRVKTE